MRRNATTGGSTLEGTHKAVLALVAKRKVGARDFRVELTEERRMYTVQVKAIDPKDQEVVNLTKLAFEGDLHGKGFPS
jgi:hypothetical protein